MELLWDRELLIPEAGLQFDHFLSPMVRCDFFPPSLSISKVVARTRDAFHQGRA